MFYDQARIHVKAGRGGDGAVAFRREKYVPYGGPSGGDGGRGGDVIFVTNPHLNTLYHFAHQEEFAAEDGQNGRNKNLYGASGQDILIPVPPGTLIFDADTDELLADLTEAEEQVVVARGGRGGRGNVHFATSTNQAPRIAEQGDPGDDRRLRLELKLLADVAIVGMPNAGKSTLLSVTTAARPAIGSYPFTTLQPNLGVVALTTNDTFVLADLPGLIEGASEGKGLGHEFLRHIERTRVLIHLLDGSALDPVEDFDTINDELKAFGHGLSGKPQLVAINKLDVPGVREMVPYIEAEIKHRGYPQVVAISAMARENTQPLMWRAYQILQSAPEPELEHPVPVIRLDEGDDEMTIERTGSESWCVHGGKVERAARRTPTQYYDALLRFHKYLESQGVLDELRQAGVQDGHTVRIGDYEFEWKDGDR